MALSQKESDIQLMLAASCHLGTKNCDYQMERYVYRRRLDGIYVINLGKTWEKLQLAARIIVAIENPQDIVVQSARPYGQRAVLKFAQYTGAKALAGRHTPGTIFHNGNGNSCMQLYAALLGKVPVAATSAFNALQEHSPIRSRRTLRSLAFFF